MSAATSWSRAGNAKDLIGLSGETLGVLSTAFLLAQTGTNLVWGRIADRTGFRFVFLASLLVHQVWPIPLRGASWLMPVIVITLLLRTIWMFNEFDMVYLFAFGGPLFGTTTLPVLVRYLAFDARQIGMAAAASSVMVVILMMMSWGYFQLYNRAEESIN